MLAVMILFGLLTILAIAVSRTAENTRRQADAAERLVDQALSDYERGLRDGARVQPPPVQERMLR